MAFLDFVRNRGAQKAPAADSKPQPTQETAKQTYDRKAREPNANGKPLETMPPEQHAKATQAAKEWEKMELSNKPTNASATPVPSDTGDSREAMRQNATKQEVAAPAQSPTSAQMGVTEQDKGGRSNVTEHSEPAVKPAQTPSNTPPPRRPPSLER